MQQFFVGLSNNFFKKKLFLFRVKQRLSSDQNNLLSLKMKRIFIIFSIMVLHVVAKNASADIDKPLTQHPLHKGWLCHSLIGILGIMLNSLVIVILYLERGSLVSSVNVMIMSESIFVKSKNILILLLFRLAAVQRLLRCIFIQWRVFCFMLDTNPLSRFNINRDMVWKRNESCIIDYLYL